MAIREKIERQLELSLIEQIEQQVEHYRDELELQAIRLGGVSHPPEEMKRLLEFKREQVKKELMRPEDRDRIERGFQTLLEEIESLPEMEMINRELEDASKKFNLNKLSGEVELQEQLGISNETYNAFYQIALKAMEEGLAVNDVEKPLSIFLYLTHLNRRFFEPHLFLGYCYQTNKEYEKALEAFYDASTLNPKHMEPFFRTVECYCALDQKERAKEVLEIMEKELADSDAISSYLNTIAQLKRSL